MFVSTNAYDYAVQFPSLLLLKYNSLIVVNVAGLFSLICVDFSLTKTVILMFSDIYVIKRPIFSRVTAMCTLHISHTSSIYILHSYTILVER